mgnify:CR=1 FL=1
MGGEGEDDRSATEEKGEGERGDGEGEEIPDEAGEKITEEAGEEIPEEATGVEEAFKEEEGEGIVDI